jgi:hypothetical protein
MSGETPPETQPKTRSTSRKAKIQSNPDRKLTSSVSRSNPPRGWAIIMMRASSAVSMATIWSVFEPTGRANARPMTGCVGPVRVKKTRQNKRPEARSDSIGTEKAPGYRCIEAERAPRALQNIVRHGSLPARAWYRSGKQREHPMHVFRVVAVLALLTAPVCAQTLIQSFDQKTPQQKADEELREKFAKESQSQKQIPEAAPKTSVDAWGNVRSGDAAKTAASKTAASKTAASKAATPKASASKASNLKVSNSKTATSVKPSNKTGNDAD